MKPVIIAIDGVDYAGKSTIVGRLKEHFSAAGYRVETVNFPTGEGYGKKARKAFIDGDVSYTAECMVRNFVEVMDELQALDGPDLIIYDRHILSTVANQGLLQAHPHAVEFGAYTHEYAPQQYYVMTLPYAVAEERAMERAEEQGLGWDDGMTEKHLASEERWVALNRSYANGAQALANNMASTSFHNPQCHNQHVIDASFASMCMNISASLEKATA